MSESHELLGLSQQGAAVLQLGRKELQRLAKNHGVKANLSSDRIVDQLLELRAKAAREQNAAGGTAASPAPAETAAAPRVRTDGPKEEPAVPIKSSSFGVPSTGSAPRSSEPQRCTPAEAHSLLPPSARAAAEAGPPPSSNRAQEATFIERINLVSAAAPLIARSKSGGQLGGAPALPSPRGAALERKHSAGVEHSPARPAAGSAAGPASLAKRKSPGFMAPLRRHSSVDVGTLKRQSTGAPRTPGRSAAEADERERGKENSALIPGVDPAMVKNILGEIIVSRQGVGWDDI
ncbi:hypothetical protein T492DRAFT_890229, partial [Pavlovales sp. CCMP2436]